MSVFSYAARDNVARAANQRALDNRAEFLERYQDLIEHADFAEALKTATAQQQQTINYYLANHCTWRDMGKQFGREPTQCRTMFVRGMDRVLHRMMEMRV